MSDLLAARSQMAISLAFHIIFAAIGIGLPLLMVIAEALWMRTGRDVYLRLTRAWAKGLAIFFAVGAVSGTVLSFELGLLWPRFMEYAGALVGMPFSLEGLAFFTEAIFLGIYLYGWDRVPRWAHFASGIMVAISGAASALFVLSVNGWMNAPTGFVAGGPMPTEIDPVAALLNPFWITNTIHMLLAAYAATAFGAATIHAWKLLSHPRNEFHRVALRIAVGVGAVAALLQPISGDFTAGVVAEHQPAKLAAMEAHYVTEACAPLRIGGIPDDDLRETRWAIEIPCGLSLLVHRRPDAVVTGLDSIPRELWPPVTPVHIAFQVMVAIGMFIALLGAWGVLRMARKKPLEQPRLYLWLLVLAGPLSFVAIQAGWVVTEVGRQPWVIYGVMLTEDAVTPMPGLVVPFTVFTLLYVFLAVVVTWLMLRLAQSEDAPPTHPGDPDRGTTDSGPPPGASGPTGEVLGSDSGGGS